MSNLNDIVSLDITISKFLYKKIKKFRKFRKNYPPDLTAKKWDKILKEMQDGFKEGAKRADDFFEYDINKLNKAVYLLQKWFPYLWM